MDVVSLPMYEANASNSIAEVLGYLQQCGRAGIIIENGNEYRLLFAGELLQAEANGVSNVQQVSGGELVLLLDSNHAIQSNVDLVRPIKTAEAYTNLLSTVGQHYALAGAIPGNAMIVTSSENERETLMITGGYQCDGTPTHYFPRPQVTIGQVCPQYPLCQCPGGKKPTVHAVP